MKPRSRARGSIDGGDLGFIALLALLAFGMWLDHAETISCYERGGTKETCNPTSKLSCSSKTEPK